MGSKSRRNSKRIGRSMACRSFSSLRSSQPKRQRMAVAFTGTGFFRNRQEARSCLNSSSKTYPVVPRLKFFQQMNQRKETKMKTKVYWLTLLASAAIVSQTQAHGFGGGG